MSERPGSGGREQTGRRRPWRSGPGKASGSAFFVASAFLVALLIGIGVAVGGLSGSTSADTAGTVHFIRSANSSFDQYTSSPSPGAQAWLRSHLWRMIVYSPYFDTKSSWYPNGWVYDDAYAIYAGQSLAAAHPEWILKDAQGAKLYIPFGCGGGSCPQYAGDISNPAFRQYWINGLKARVAHADEYDLWAERK